MSRACTHTHTHTRHSCVLSQHNHFCSSKGGGHANQALAYIHSDTDILPEGSQKANRGVQVPQVLLVYFICPPRQQSSINGIKYIHVPGCFKKFYSHSLQCAPAPTHSPSPYHYQHAHHQLCHTPYFSRTATQTKGFSCTELKTVQH